MVGKCTVFIARRLELNKQAGIEMYGVTVTDIVDNLSVTRPVQHKGENNQLEYKKKTNIDRKHAERIITNLRNMSLCFIQGLLEERIFTLLQLEVCKF